MAIKIKLEGFDELISQIEKAGGNINSACESVMRKSADIIEQELKSAMKDANVSTDLINKMPAPEFNSTGNRISAKVCYKSTKYDQKNPSDYIKAIFLNYGTPHRKKHGKIVARGFIQKAKKKANTKIKKQQQETLEKILENLKG